MQSGITAATPGRILLDAGAIYRDYGLPGQLLLGATRGGATFTVDKEERTIELDGMLGGVKGLRRVIRHVARLEVTFVELSQALFVELMRATVTSTTPHRTYTPSNAIVAADYKNVALVADMSGTATPVIIKLLQALATGEWAITTEDQDEGTITVRWEAHYDPATMNVPPYQVLLPLTAS